MSHETLDPVVTLRGFSFLSPVGGNIPFLCSGSRQQAAELLAKARGPGALQILLAVRLVIGGSFVV